MSSSMVDEDEGMDDDGGFQTLPVQKVMRQGNPFKGCWTDVKVPIKLTEITACLERGGEALTETERNSWDPVASDARERHVAKIAWFVRNGFNDPIDIDVGIPSLGCEVDYPIMDGNHRLASCIYRHKIGEANVMVPAVVSGSIDHAIELGLWIDTHDLVQDLKAVTASSTSTDLSPTKARRPR